MTQDQLNGLIGEVEDIDIYHMRDKADIVSINDPKYIHLKGHKRAFDFIPDVIFDLGANVGVFTRYANRLFPDARIIAVEPDDINAEKFLKNKPDNVTFIKAGIGNGTLYRAKGALNGSGECYLSNDIGYKGIDKIDFYQAQKIKSVQVCDLINEYVKDGEKFIIKMDIEGSENTVFKHKKSMDALLKADYFTCELHYFAMDGSQLDEVIKTTEKALKKFEKTHRCTKEEGHFYATKIC